MLADRRREVWPFRSMCRRWLLISRHAPTRQKASACGPWRWRTYPFRRCCCRSPESRDRDKGIIGIEFLAASVGRAISTPSLVTYSLCCAAERALIRFGKMGSDLPFPVRCHASRSGHRDRDARDCRGLRQTKTGPEGPALFRWRTWINPRRPARLPRPRRRRPLRSRPRHRPQNAGLTVLRCWQ